MNYVIEQKFLTKNRTHIKFKPKGAIVHETATPGATDENEYDYVVNSGTTLFAHFYVDWNSISQFVPVNEVAYQAKGGNSEYIGIECCHVKGHNPGQFKAMWDRATWLFAHLFCENPDWGDVNSYSLPAHKDITDRKNIEGGHVDPIDYFAEYGKTVNDFRNDVKKKINEMKNIKKEVVCMFKDCANLSDEEKKAINYLAENGICKGDGKGNFGPDDNLTRKQMALMLKRFADLIKVK